jgi:hypothetical protein
MQVVGLVETDQKIFKEFSSLGIETQKQQLQFLYDDLAKAKEKGDPRKIAEISGQIEGLREQLSARINIKTEHEKRLELFSKLSDPMKDYIVTKYGGMQNWNPDNAKMDEAEFLKFSQGRYLGTHPDAATEKTKGELTDNQVLENLDIMASERGKITLKPTLYDEYFTMRKTGAKREDAYNAVVKKYFGSQAGAGGAGKSDLGKGLWK